nr:sugar ABC transporter permease [uncultured Cohaesibacter sp.]
MLGFPAVLDLIYSVSTVSFENLRSPTLSGFGNYREVLADPYFWSAVSFSTRFGLLTALLETALGLFLAVFLAPLIQKRFWLMAIFMMPMIIAPSMMGLMYRLVLHEFVGPLPYYLFEFFGQSPAFLSPKLAFKTLVVIETLQWTPFTLLLFYTAYSSIPLDIREAAKVDGTRGLRLFTHIELPALLPTLVVAFGIRFIDGFRVFDNIYVLIGAGAGGSATSLSIYIYTAFFKSADIGKALAASVLLFVVAFVLLWLVGWLLKKRKQA